MELDSETEDSGEYVPAIESTDDSSCEDGGDAGKMKTAACSALLFLTVCWR